jgi:hypothetical protein
MHPNAILREVQQLYNVSDRLDSANTQRPIRPADPHRDMRAVRSEGRGELAAVAVKTNLQTMDAIQQLCTLFDEKTIWK